MIYTTYIHTYIYMYVYIYICIDTYIHSDIIDTCMHTYMYMQSTYRQHMVCLPTIYLHTYIHTYIQIGAGNHVLFLIFTFLQWASLLILLLLLVGALGIKSTGGYACMCTYACIRSDVDQNHIHTYIYTYAHTCMYCAYVHTYTA